jgi:hypothetical protein
VNGKLTITHKKVVKEKGLTKTINLENTEGIIIEKAFNASSNNVNKLALLLPPFLSTIEKFTYSMLLVNFDRYIRKKGFGSSFSIIFNDKFFFIKQNSLVPETYFLPEINFLNKK